jgi:hypothetical protein
VNLTKSVSLVFAQGNVKLESGPRVQVDKSAGVIRFKPLLKSDEDKLYNCTATNDVGSDSAVGELKVLGQCVCSDVELVRVSGMSARKQN